MGSPTTLVDRTQPSVHSSLPSSASECKTIGLRGAGFSIFPASETFTGQTGLGEGVSIGV